MQLSYKIHLIFFAVISSFALVGQTDTFSASQPLLFINNFRKPVENGVVLNCRKISDLGVRIFMTESVKKYELVKLELHRFGAKTNDDDLLAYKTFKPYEKEFEGKE